MAREVKTAFIIMLIVLVETHADIFQKINMNTFTYAYVHQVGYLEEEKECFGIDGQRWPEIIF